MALQHQIDTDLHRVTVTGEGRIDVSSARKLLADVPNESAYESSYDILIDLASAVGNPSPADMRNLVRWFPALDVPNSNKIAVVVSNSFHYGMARMASILSTSKNVNFHVFLDMEEALAWMNDSAAGPPMNDQLSA